ncbi:PREDICTED: uncharacterized protein LOC105975517 [Erythranthe guttata]|uniref:uncharacterized protein LOC105975517 n=1 Tax=Erythranthe guttata TaxID=4155 RepID=UPI00064E085A|nr:PREDICTED: uncharacterized protein LOC105975517 [Erythranthe guttata]|eukprot:XP_012856168.1 PREDICTED: uncharacterized protein LOC105975517 [Erythranthe guttata]
MVKQGKQQGIVVKEDCSKLSIGCRCSPIAFHLTMEGVKKVMKKQHHEVLKKNPFYHYMDMPKINHSFHRVVSLMQAYNPEDRAFWFGGNTIRLEFTPQQLSIVLGLQYEGVPVDVNMDGRDTDFITRIFDGKLSLVTRPYIGYKLEAYAVMTDQQSVEDFSRLYTIYLLNTILLPKGNKTLERWVYPHVEDLEVLGSFAWGKLVYDILVENMEGYLKGGLKYFDGCTIGLLAWVHERITSLGVSTSVYKFPRFFRWQDSKIPIDEEAARLLFDQIKQVQVIPFSVYPKEKALLSPVLEVISGPVVGISADRFVEISSESSEDEIGDVEATSVSH